MKWELDDNARSGFHYLLLGALVIGLPGLVIFLIDHWQTGNVSSDQHKLQVFRNGYLLGDPLQLTTAFTTRSERIAAAVLTAFICGGTVAGLLWVFGLRTQNWAVGRWTALAVFSYFIYAAVAMPRRKCTVSQNEVVRVQYACVPFTDLPIPFTEKIDTLNFGPDPEVRSIRDGHAGVWRLFLRDANMGSEIAISDADSISVASGTGYLNHLASAR